MREYLSINMPDGTIWKMNTMIIAIHRAEHYKSKYGDNLTRSLQEDTIPLFKEDEYDILNWAMNNMDWADVRDYAVRVFKPEPSYVDYDDGWMNGNKEFSD